MADRLHRRPGLIVGFFMLFLGAVAIPAPAGALETEAREAFLIDLETGTVLLDKNSEERMPPASMSKIMTTYVVFQHLKDGRLSLDDELPVSEKAWRKGGSKMFVELGSHVRVEDLLRGVIVQSGNDACIVLAEGLAGSEEAFAEEMTKVARDIGLKDSHFANATGWPDPDHWMTARDLALLAQRIIEQFPEHYSFYSETEFTWSDIKQRNRNPLLYTSLGADGLKTGHTEEAGYGLTVSAERDGRRVILVVNGLSSEKARAEESARLIGWAFREFENYVLLEAGEVAEQAKVWYGQSDTVPLVAPEAVKATLSRKANSEMIVKVVYDGPIPAPIEKGDTIAQLVVSGPDVEPLAFPLQAGESVERLGVFGRMVASLKHMVFGTP